VSEDFDFERALSELLDGNRRVSKFNHVSNKHKKKFKMICHKCGNEITPGSLVYRKPRSGRNYKTHYYHVACWLELWLDL